MLAFRQVDSDQMMKVEHELTTVLVRFKEHTEASLVIFALLRCARVLLKQYPPATKAQLTRILVDFLEERTAPRDDPEAHMLVM